MSAYILPVLFASVILYGLLRGVDVYDAFAQGASEAIPTLVRILPYLATMMIAISLVRESGLLDRLTILLRPFCRALGFDSALVPLLLIRPFSGSAAMATFRELCTVYGADSDVANIAAVLMGSSETIFYEVALYYGAAKIRHSGFAVPVALAAMAVSVVMSILLVRWMV